MEVLNIINHWWEEEGFPRELLKARVVLMYKKGEASDLANYRPISLLNSIYKIYAAMLQKRMAATESYGLPNDASTHTRRGSTNEYRSSGIQTAHGNFSAGPLRR